MIPWHMSDWSLNDLHASLGYETDRSGEDVVLRRGDESRNRGSYDQAAYVLCVNGELAWYPSICAWARVRGFPAGRVLA